MCCSVFCSIDNINKGSQNSSLYNVCTPCVSVVFLLTKHLCVHTTTAPHKNSFNAKKKGTFPHMLLKVSGVFNLFSPAAGDRSSQTRIQGLWFWAEPLVGLVFPLQGLEGGRAPFHVLSHLRPVEGETWLDAQLNAFSPH